MVKRHPAYPLQPSTAEAPAMHRLLEHGHGIGRHGRVPLELAGGQLGVGADSPLERSCAGLAHPGTHRVGRLGRPPAEQLACVGSLDVDA